MMISKISSVFVKKTLFILMIFSLASYQFIPKSKKVNGKSIVVDLDHKQFDDDFFTDDDFYYTSLKLGSFNSHPKYSEFLKDNYKGIPQNDSVSFYHSMDDRFLSSELHKHADLNKEDEEWYLSHKDIDTLNLSKVKLKSTLIVVIGFYKNRQFMIADANRNKDFSDDVKFEYDVNFRNNPYENIAFLNKQPIQEYTYEDCYKGNIQAYNRRFIIYPDRDNPWSISDRVNPKKEREYFSILKFRDFWKGEIRLNNEDVEFYYHGYRNSYGLLYVKPKNIPYKRNGVFDTQYSHKNYSNDKFDDTISIGKSRYKIDSINRDISKLYLREVGKRNHYGNQVGDYIKNINFKDLANKTFKTNNIIGKKKYTLLEFWGTWCGACVGLTPKLKATNQKYSTILNMVSIAVDEDVLSVKKYIKKHNVNWKIGYISKYRSWGNPILKQLNIKYFPTFILIDSKGKIIQIADSDNFDDILKSLKLN